MENREALIVERTIKWKLLFKSFEAKFKSDENDEGIPFLYLENYVAVNEAMKKKKFRNKSKQNRHEDFSVLELSDTFAIKTERTKYHGTYNGHRPYRKCRSFNRNQINLFLPKNNRVTRTRTLKKSSNNKTSKNIEDKNTSNKNPREDKSTFTQKNKIDNICKMLMERKSIDGNINDKLSAMELTSYNNNNLKITDSYESSSSGYQSANISRRSSFMTDIITDSNRKLIQRMIDGISKKLSKSQKNILTLNKLADLNLEMSISPMDRKCIRFYLKQTNCCVKESVLFKLVQLMEQEEYKTIQMYILGMEIFQCLNDTDNEEFRCLCSKLEEEMAEFLESNEIKILELHVDYVISTFNCRKKRYVLNK